MSNARLKNPDVDQLKDYIGAYPKGSPELRSLRNFIWKKIAEKEPDPDLLKTVRKLYERNGMDAVKMAQRAIRREHPRNSRASVRRHRRP